MWQTQYYPSVAWLHSKPWWSISDTATWQHDILYIQWNLSSETTSMRDHLSWRTTYSWQKVQHFNATVPVTRDRPVWGEHIFMVNRAVFRDRFYCIYIHEIQKEKTFTWQRTAWRTMHTVLRSTAVSSPLLRPSQNARVYRARSACRKCWKASWQVH